MPVLPGGAVEAVGALRGAVRGSTQVGAPLAPFTTFRLGGPAAVAVEALDEADLVATGDIARRFRLPLLVLGRGSNMLISDHGFPGIVLRMGRGFDWVRADGAGVQAGAAVLLPKLANWAGRRALSGLEFAVAIPASLGGAVWMNAGAHGSCMGAVLDWVRVYRLGEAEADTLAASSLPMAYRSGGLGRDQVVCSARLTLREAPAQEVAARMQAFRDHRAATQPGQARNAGSMFQNAGESAAGALIEAAGLKGFQVGGAEVSRKHANFFVATPGTSAQEVYGLLVAVQAAVQEHSGVLLVPEVRIVGSFEGPALRRPPTGSAP